MLAAAVGIRFRCLHIRFHQRQVPGSSTEVKKLQTANGEQTVLPVPQLETHVRPSRQKLSDALPIVFWPNANLSGEHSSVASGRVYRDRGVHFHRTRIGK